MSRTTRELLALGLPAAGLQLLWVTALAVDTAMVARLSEAEAALAGLGYATQVVFLTTVPMTALCVATVARASRHLGAGDPGAARRVVSTASLALVAYSASLALLGGGGAVAALGALEPAPEVSAQARAYLDVLLAGSVFLHLNMLLSATARAHLDARVPLAIGLGANLLNVVLDAALIGGVGGVEGLGVTGAAVGTVASQALASLWLGARLARRGAVGRPIFDPIEARRLLAIAAPVAGELALLNASFLLFLAMVGRFGAGAAAAHTVGLRVQALAYVVATGMAQATAALTGRALGEGGPLCARAIASSATRATALLAGGVGLLLLALAEPIGRGLSDPAGASLAVTWIRVLGLTMPLVGVCAALRGVFRGAGSTSVDSTLAVLSVLGVQLPLGYALGYAAGLGPLGVWLAFPAAFAARAGMQLGALRRGALGETEPTRSALAILSRS